MRAYVPTYELKKPGTLQEALELIASDPAKWRPFAGGTDLMVLFESGKLEHRNFVSLWGLGELGGIDTQGDSVRIGALTTYTQIRTSSELAQHFPLLTEAARETGALAIQNRGTIGGNVANASPAADSPPALIAYDAEIELVGLQGKRRLPYVEFHTGYKTTVLRPGELVSAFWLKRPQGNWRSFYRKVGTRKAQAISKVCVAARARIEDGRVKEARVALGSVAPTVLRARAIENAVVNQLLTTETYQAAREAALECARPIDDIRSTALYRARVCGNVIVQWLEELAKS